HEVIPNLDPKEMEIHDQCLRRTRTKLLSGGTPRWQNDPTNDHRHGQVGDSAKKISGEAPKSSPFRNRVTANQIENGRRQQRCREAPGAIDQEQGPEAGGVQAPVRELESIL